MKNLLKLPIFVLYLLVLVACSADPSTPFQGPVDNGGNPGGDNTGGGNNGGDNTGGVPIGNPTSANVYFGFLDGDGSSTTYIDMPAESYPANLLIGRWKITKLGIDENHDGTIHYYNYADFKHDDCGLSFLQFNTNGVVFENSYYKTDGGICTLYSEMDEWELLQGGRLKIYVYDNIYIIKVSDSHLILKYDWDFENSLYGPAQVYYYYDRIAK